MKVTEIER